MAAGSSNAGARADASAWLFPSRALPGNRVFPAGAGLEHMGPKAHGISRSERIGRRADFQEIYKRGIRLGGRFMTLFVLPNSLETARLGIAATQKLGDAVRRNRAKRLVRELFRGHKPGSALDIVVVPRREFFDASRPALDADYCATLARLARARVVR